MMPAMEWFHEFIRNFLLAFVPLFVALDGLGIAPIFLAMSDGMTETSRRRLVTQATMTAFVIAVVFLFSGKLLFNFLGITQNDFRVGGGIVLLILGIVDLLFSQNQQRRNPGEHSIGVVPIGIPLIMGPAAMTTIIILAHQHGYVATFASLLVNLFIVWLVFRNVSIIIKVIGPGGAKAFGKVASLLLVAIAVMMIRVGITNFIESAGISSGAH